MGPTHRVVKANASHPSWRQRLLKPKLSAGKRPRQSRVHSQLTNQTTAVKAVRWCSANSQNEHVPLHCRVMVHSLPQEWTVDSAAAFIRHLNGKNYSRDLKMLNEVLFMNSRAIFLKANVQSTLNKFIIICKQNKTCFTQICPKYWWMVEEPLLPLKPIQCVKSFLLHPTQDWCHFNGSSASRLIQVDASERSWRHDKTFYGMFPQSSLFSPLFTR